MKTNGKLMLVFLYLSHLLSYLWKNTKIGWTTSGASILVNAKCLLLNKLIIIGVLVDASCYEVECTLWFFSV